jgi:hypothetical protein
MTFLKLPDGTVAHVRMSPPRARRCKVCNRKTNHRWLRECDFVLPNGKTCNLLMCWGCAKPIGPNMDLCPVHDKETEAAIEAAKKALKALAQETRQ